jgi:hypothetical protein
LQNFKKDKTTSVEYFEKLERKMDLTQSSHLITTMLWDIVKSLSPTDVGWNDNHPLERDITNMTDEVKSFLSDFYVFLTSATADKFYLIKNILGDTETDFDKTFKLACKDINGSKKTIPSPSGSRLRSPDFKINFPKYFIILIEQLSSCKFSKKYADSLEDLNAIVVKDNNKYELFGMFLETGDGEDRMWTRIRKGKKIVTNAEGKKNIEDFVDWNVSYIILKKIEG